MAQVALAWVLAQPGITSVIVGASSVEQLDDNLAAADLDLDAAELAASTPPRHWRRSTRRGGILPWAFRPRTNEHLSHPDPHQNRSDHERMDRSRRPSGRRQGAVRTHHDHACTTGHGRVHRCRGHRVRVRRDVAPGCAHAPRPAMDHPGVRGCRRRADPDGDAHVRRVEQRRRHQRGDRRVPAVLRYPDGLAQGLGHEHAHPDRDDEDRGGAGGRDGAPRVRALDRPDRRRRPPRPRRGGVCRHPWRTRAGGADRVSRPRVPRLPLRRGVDASTSSSPGATVAS